MSQSLHTKYRPQTLEEVVGHAEVIKSLNVAVSKKRVRTFLFVGPSGTGKTTLARILAKNFGCSPQYVLDVDAATNNGIENVREIQETLRYRPMGKDKMRAIIMDEAHMLSKAAWNSLLKVLEDVPPHVVWFFCTTEPDKVPQTVRTRCAAFTLSSLSVVQLKKIRNRVAEAEEIKLSPDIIELIAKESQGSPRQALVYLDSCSEATTVKEASKLLQSAIASDATLELCRLLVGLRGSWEEAMAIIEKLKSESPEGVRIVVCNYVAAVLKKSKNGKVVAHLLGVLEAFEGTFNQSEKLAPLLLAIGRVLCK
jgi:DNA polymerase-3 subunit gamma/tau